MEWAIGNVGQHKVTSSEVIMLVGNTDIRIVYCGSDCVA